MRMEWETNGKCTAYASQKTQRINSWIKYGVASSIINGGKPSNAFHRENIVKRKLQWKIWKPFNVHSKITIESAQNCMIRENAVKYSNLPLKWADYVRSPVRHFHTKILLRSTKPKTVTWNRGNSCSHLCGVNHSLCMWNNKKYLLGPWTDQKVEDYVRLSVAIYHDWWLHCSGYYIYR